MGEPEWEASSRAIISLWIWRTVFLPPLKPSCASLSRLWCSTNMVRHLVTMAVHSLYIAGNRPIGR